MIVHVRVFRSSGKWYTDETTEVPDGLKFHEVIEHVREYARKRWPDWFVAAQRTEPEHEHDHPFMIVPGGS